MIVDVESTPTGFPVFQCHDGVCSFLDTIHTRFLQYSILWSKNLEPWTNNKPRDEKRNNHNKNNHGDNKNSGHKIHDVSFCAVNS